jgi:hypothetical protein
MAASSLYMMMMVIYSCVVNQINVSSGNGYPILCPCRQRGEVEIWCYKVVDA